MRLFVAVWPPAEVVTHLTAAIAEMSIAEVSGGEMSIAEVSGGEASGGEPALPEVRWVIPDQVHLTLGFLGEVTHERRSELERRLTRVADRYPPVTLHLAGAGRFGGRVLFVKVAGDRDRLRRLADSVNAAARRADLDVGDRSFRAHVTVARAKASTDLRPLVAALDGYLSSTWTARELHLVHSRLGAGPGGRPAYDTVATWRLGGRDG